MPNRLIREGIIASDRVNALDAHAEVFYRRLMSKVDDHGLYDARPSILRSALYPLRLNKVKEVDCVRWLSACEEAGLVKTYAVEGKPYLQVLDTRWQVRSDPKYPLPPVNGCKQLRATGHLVVVGDVVGVEDDKSNVGLKPDVPRRQLRQEALEILVFLNEKVGRDYQPGDANLDLIVARLKEGATVDDCKAVVAKKCREWATDEKMAIYLRPATLFNRTKFAQYRGELGMAA